MTITDGARPLAPAVSEFDPTGAANWATARGLPAYRGRQLYAALTKRAIQDWSELTEFPATLRAKMAAVHRVRTLRVCTHLHSKRDGSEKVVFGLHDGATVESVLITSRNSTGKSRLTVCVSSQVGCAAGCSFCATGLSGFGRNLTAPEIVDQVMYFAHALKSDQRRISNIVFMGMGEPLMNTSEVAESVRRLTDPEGFGIGDRHITVSTVGIVPQIRKFASWAGQVNLAISLHAPNDSLRATLVPYNRHFPIADLLDAARDYVESTRRRVSFEYVLLRGVNDSPELATELAEILLPFGGLAHVNLIPWNPFREGRFVRSEGPDAEAFAHVLMGRGVNATVRYSKGLDISAACGQLRDQVKNRR